MELPSESPTVTKKPSYGASAAKKSPLCALEEDPEPGAATDNEAEPDNEVEVDGGVLPPPTVLDTLLFDDLMVEDEVLLVRPMDALPDGRKGPDVDLLLSLDDFLLSG